MRYTKKLTATFLSSTQLLSLALLIPLALGGLVACSGGNDNSVPPPPADTIDNTNIQSYSQSIANNIFLADTSSTSTSSSYTNQLANAYTQMGDAIAASQNIPPGTYNQNITQDLVQVYDQSFNICNTNNTAASHVSGIMSITYVSSVNFSFSGTVNFNQLCFDDGQGNQLIMNGGISFSGDQNGITVDFNNFGFTINGQTNVANCSVSVSSSGTSSSCGDITNSVINYSNNSDNSLLSGITVTSDANGSYVNIDGSINTANGYLNIITDTPLKICSNGSGGFESGLLVLNGSNSSQATLDFTDPSCSTATWCISDSNGGQICDVVAYR